MVMGDIEWIRGMVLYFVLVFVLHTANSTMRNREGAPWLLIVLSSGSIVIFAWLMRWLA